MSLRRARHPTAPVGPLIETFALGELTRQLAFTDQPVRLYHYRDRDQYEVDAILESASGEVIACEVKAAETVRSEDFRGIQRLAAALVISLWPALCSTRAPSPCRSATGFGHGLYRPCGPSPPMPAPVDSSGWVIWSVTTARADDTRPGTQQTRGLSPGRHVS
jgi:hypothetical protein